MKERVVFCCFFLFLLYFQGFTQNQNYVSEAWASEQFGERFVSADEVGYKNLVIPYTKENLQYDRLSWLIPVIAENQYKRIQARYLFNKYEKNDTLSLAEAEETIKMIIKTDRNFPDEKSFKFFKTKDVVYVQDTKCLKTIVYYNKEYSVIDLPADVCVVILGKNYVSYIVDEKEKISISLDFREINSRQEEPKGFSVMTLVSLSLN